MKRKRAGRRRATTRRKADSVAREGRGWDSLPNETRRGETRGGGFIRDTRRWMSACLGRLSAGRRGGGETGAEAGHDDSDECRGRDAE